MIIVQTKDIFYFNLHCESDSTITNVCSFVRSFVRLSVCKTPPQLEIIILHHPSSFFIHPFFISRLLSFSACFNFLSKITSCRSSDHFTAPPYQTAPNSIPTKLGLRKKIFSYFKCTTTLNFGEDQIGCSLNCILLAIYQIKWEKHIT